jgi:peptide/nickel transport system permease protein
MAAPQQKLEAKDESQWRAIGRRFLRNKAAVVGLGVLVVLYAIAILAPHVAPYPLDYLDPVVRKLPPLSPGHFLGTDHLGRDVWSRMVWGARISLSVGFISMGFAVTIGTLVGALAGFYGGTWIDILLMRLAEAIDLIPIYFLLITVVGVFRPNIFNIMLIIGVTSWPSIAFIVRGQFLSLRERRSSRPSTGRRAPTSAISTAPMCRSTSDKAPGDSRAIP